MQIFHCRFPFGIIRLFSTRSANCRSLLHSYDVETLEYHILIRELLTLIDLLLYFYIVHLRLCNYYIKYAISYELNLSFL